MVAGMHGRLGVALGRAFCRGAGAPTRAFCRGAGAPTRALRLFVSVGLLAACAPPSTRVVPAAPTPPSLPWAADAAPAPEGASVPEVASPATALVGGTVMTGTGVELADATVTFADGRILAVGPRASVPVPDGATVVDVSGRFVTPGLIDAHSHMGVYPMPELAANADGNEATRPVTANVRAADSVWPQDPAFSHALASGITTALVLPGSANLVGGQGVTLKLRPGRGVADMKFPGAPATLKMACGENPKRVYGQRHTAPSTRMGNMAGYREAFQSAREYGAKFTDWQRRHQGWQKKRALPRGDEQAPAASGSDEPEPSMPDRDYGLETLLGAIEGRVLVEIHCYRADDMLAMLALADEFGLEVRAFHHAVEAYKIRDVLAERNVAVATWADWWGFKLEAFDTVRENLALLAESGVRGVLHSDSSLLVQRLNQEAAKSLSSGLRAGVSVDRGTALAWITSNPAWALGIDAQTGSLEPGKMADVVVWSQDPFSVYSLVEQVYVDGLELYDASSGRRASDFELGQAAEVPNRPAPKPARVKANPAAPPPSSAGAVAPPPSNGAPSAPSGVVPSGVVPSGVAPSNSTPGAAPSPPAPAPAPSSPASPTPPPPTAVPPSSQMPKKASEVLP
jgi:imidazolonepropionase-like amidohydrolase